MTNDNPQQLWILQPDQFNEWRQNNDLPLLLQFLRNELPSFPDWMSQNGVTDEMFIKAPHTGEWFLGETVREFVCYRENGDAKFVISNEFDTQFSFLAKHKNIEKLKTVSFKPYLAWGAEREKKRRFIPIDQGNSNKSESLIYGMWTEHQGITHAHLLKQFKVLKLGQINLHDHVYISSRNLDFADLDFLTISGQFHGSYASTINFSSCRNLSLINGGLHHITFSCCVVEQLRCIGSRMQDFIFRNSEVDNLEIRNSTINGLSFENSRLASPVIERTDIQRLQYNPRRGRLNYSAEADVCRRFRNAFQNIGRRAESSEFFFRERCLERKALWSPYLHYRSEFPKRKYAGRLHNLYHHWKDGDFDRYRSLELLIDLLLFHFKVWIIPIYVLKSLRYKVRYFISFFEYLIWGYGEKPSRVVIMALSAMIVFALLFYHHGPTKSSVVDSIYFSVMTILTYGDIHPVDNYTRLACSVEALIGALSLGLLIAGFANKSRY